MWLLGLPWSESARIRLPRERRLFPWYYRPADTARLAELLTGILVGVERHAILPWPAVQALARNPEPDRWKNTILVTVVHEPDVSVERLDEVLDALGAPHAMGQLREPVEHGYGWQEQHVKRALLRRLQIELSAPEHALATFNVQAMPLQKAASLAADALDFLDLVESAVAHRLERAAGGVTAEDHLASLWWAAGRLVAERLLRIRPDGVPAALDVVLARGRRARGDRRSLAGAEALQGVGLARVVGADVSLGPLARAVTEEPAVLAALRERIPELPGGGPTAREVEPLERMESSLVGARRPGRPSPRGVEPPEEPEEERAGLEALRGPGASSPVEPSGKVDVPESVARLEEVLRLKGRTAETRAAAAPFGAHLRVKGSDGGTVAPWAALPGGVDEDLLEAFLRDIDAPYRVFDPALVSTLVHAGEAPSRELLERAADGHVRLVSFAALQRDLMDLGPYLAEQTRRLENDPLYPPSMYVDQRIVLSGGGQEGEHERAIEALSEALSDEQGRFVLVLGDFGTGKTFLLHELARRMVVAGSETPPILIHLRELEKAHQLDALLGQHFASAGVPFDAKVFRYLMREGRVALLFDGFDELALRVRYDRATAHLETLLQAAEGRARVVVTSRTQHFESDRQVKTALAERLERTTRRTVARLLPFDRPQMARFLERRLGQVEAARQRLALIEQVKDLAGLSANPRMLSFIAGLPEADLLRARNREGQISAASLYRRLLERWFEVEGQRVLVNQSAVESLSTEERWAAVTALALHLWVRTERWVAVGELPRHVAEALLGLSAHDMDHETAAHQVGSATLLVRDAEGRFSFLHQSVMEWLVADAAARALAGGAGGDVSALESGEMSPLMADFLIDLAPPGGAVAWARAVTQGEAEDGAKRNALMVLRRAGADVERANYRGMDLRGQDFSGRDLTGADFTGADLTDAQFVGTKMRGAILRKAKLANANLEKAVLTNADLAGAELQRARLLGTDLTGATFEDALLHGSDLAGATPGDDDPLDDIS